MKLKVAGLVTEGEVVLSQLGFGSVKRQLVAGQPALVAQDGSCVDGGAGHVEVKVAPHVDKVALVARLQFGTFLPEEGNRGTQGTTLTSWHCILIRAYVLMAWRVLPSVGHK